MEALSQVLLLEASSNYDIETWNSILETLVAAILKCDNLNDMSIQVRLCISITVVGSHRTDFFENIFGLMFDWEFSRGCWWLIQEELLRHYYVGGFHQELSQIKSLQLKDRDKCVCNLRQKLIQLKNRVAGLSHPLLTKRLTILHDDLRSLLDKIKFSPYILEPLDKYAKEYPLQQFSCWFIAWAQLKLSENTFSNEMTKNSPSSYSSTNKKLGIHTNLSYTETADRFTMKRKYTSSLSKVDKSHEKTCNATNPTNDMQHMNISNKMKKANINVEALHSPKIDIKTNPIHISSVPNLKNERSVMIEQRRDILLDSPEPSCSVHHAAILQKQKKKETNRVCEAAQAAHDLLISHRHSNYKLSSSTARTLSPVFTEIKLTDKKSEINFNQLHSTSQMRHQTTTVHDVDIYRNQVCGIIESNINRNELQRLSKTFKSAIRSSNHFNFNNENVKEDSTSPKPLLTEQQIMSNSLLVKYFVIKPIAIAKALSAEVWQAFSPESQYNSV